eukprot:1278143-Rhodomonas_salina.2
MPGVVSGSTVSGCVGPRLMVRPCAGPRAVAPSAGLASRSSSSTPKRQWSGGTSPSGHRPGGRTGPCMWTRPSVSPCYTYFMRQGCLSNSARPSSMDGAAGLVAGGAVLSEPE